MNPIISVVIPCHFQFKYLQESVESVVNQTFANWEILIVASRKIDFLAALCVRDTFPQHSIYVVHDEGKGVGNARNIGIHAASGDYILPLDADDKLDPTYLERVYNEIDRTTLYAIASTWMQEFGDRNGAWDLPPYDADRIREENSLCITSLFTKQLWSAVGGYSTAYLYEDWDFWMRCSELHPDVTIVKDRLFYYRAHATSATQSVALYEQHIKAVTKLHTYNLRTKDEIDLYAELWGSAPDELLMPVEKRAKQFPHDLFLSAQVEIIHKYRAEHAIL